MADVTGFFGDEDPYIHWPNIDVEGRVVLDLGAGDFGRLPGGEQSYSTTGDYWLAQGARKVVAVDANAEDLGVYAGNPKVETVNTLVGHTVILTHLLEYYRPQLVKVDIEGDEGLLLELPMDILTIPEAYAIETHNYDLFDQVYALLERAGYEIRWALRHESMHHVNVIYAERAAGQPPRRPRVFDLTMVHWELDMLEFRMREMWDVVDKFIVTEGLVDHRGRPRELVLTNSLDTRFAWAKEKLVVNVCQPLEDAQTTWDREYHQREQSILAVKQFDPCPDDLLLVADCDEIFRPSVVTSLVGRTGVFQMQMPMFYYYFNLFFEPWGLPTALSYGQLTNPREVRCHPRPDEIIYDAGWHFSYLGSPEQIAYKIQSYAHDEFDLPHIVDLANIEDAMTNKVDLLRRDTSGEMRAVPLDDTWPRYLLENRERYAQFILDV